MLGLAVMRDKSSPLVDLINSYLTARTDWAESTRKWTSVYLLDFEAFVTTSQGRRAQISDLDPMVVAAYVAQKKLTSLHSGRAAAVTVRGLGAFAEEIGTFSENPLRKLRVPKPPEDSRQPLRDDQTKRVLEVAGDCPRPGQAARDVAIISLFLDSTVRFKELRLLELDDIDWTRRVLTVRSVNSKGTRGSRDISLGVNVMKRLDNYLSNFRADVAWPQVFLTVDGKPLKKGGLDSLIDRLSQRSGVDFSAHILRHTGLTMDARAHGDTTALAYKAGWTPKSTVRMAQRYTGHRNFVERRVSALDQVLASTRANQRASEQLAS